MSTTATRPATSAVATATATASCCGIGVDGGLTREAAETSAGCHAAARNATSAPSE